MTFRPCGSPCCGPGGVGGLLAAALPNALVREPRRAHGDPACAVVSSVTGQQRALRSTRLDEPVDVLFIATKATGLRRSARADRNRSPARGPAAQRLRAPRAGCANASARRRRRRRSASSPPRVEPGVIEQTSPFLRIELARTRRMPRAPAERGGDPPAVGDGEAQVMWSKLVRLNAIALTTTAFDAPLGEVRDHHARRLRRGRASRRPPRSRDAEGATIDADAIEHELLECAPRADRLDGARRRRRPRPELDAIAGAVLRAAARHGIPSPTSQRLVAAIAARSTLTPWPTSKVAEEPPGVPDRDQRPRPREPDHTAWGIGLAHFDMERLGFDEGEEILPGITIHADGGVTGNFRVLCDGEHDEELEEAEEAESSRPSRLSRSRRVPGSATSSSSAGERRHVVTARANEHDPAHGEQCGDPRADQRGRHVEAVAAGAACGAATVGPTPAGRPAVAASGERRSTDPAARHPARPGTAGRSLPGRASTRSWRPGGRPHVRVRPVLRWQRRRASGCGWW